MKENLLFQELMGDSRESGDPVLETLYKGNRSAFEKIKKLVLCNDILPFIGAGFSAEAYPAWNAFLLDTAAAYPACEKEVRECMDQGQYEEAAEKLCVEMTDFSFRNKISETFGKNTLAGKLEKISPDRKRLNEIFRHSVITTNYDRVLEAIYHQEMETVCPHTEYQQSLLDKILHSGQPALVKLHGDIEDISHIVITGGDYEKVYGSPAAQDTPGILVSVLKQILQSRTVLFLGCSLCSDRTMQVLLDSAGKGREYYALAELPKETENPEDPFAPLLVNKDGSENPVYRKRRQFMGEHHINCIWYPYGKHAALDALLRELYKEFCPVKIPAGAGRGSSTAKRKIVGREDAINELSNIFLTQDKILFVTGTGGIGKTELCRSVIERHPEFEIPYIELFGVDSLEAFCAKVAAAIGYGDLPETNDMDGNWNLLAGAMLDGAKKYDGLYLDNWEDLWIGLAKNREKRMKLLGWLEGLVAHGIKVMVSSREQPRKYNFRIHIYPVDPLDSGKGYDSQLFYRIYHEKGGKLAPEGREYHDMLEKLGGHPLSIVLAATFASAKTSWESVLETWTHAEMWGENERHNSLRTALGISWESLSEEPVCLDIWGVLALCIDNPKTKWMAEVLQCSEEESDQALTVLYDSSLISWGDHGTVVMLPPVKEVFFQLASQEQIERALKRHGVWMEKLIEKTAFASKDRYSWHSQLIDMLPQIYYVAVKMMEADLLSEMIVSLCYGLGNYYKFNSVQSLDFLKKCLVFAREKRRNVLVAFVLERSGDMKSRLGEPDEAMKLYGEAEGLYRGERSNLGLANVLRSKGDLKSRLGDLGEALELYEEAEGLYRRERSNLGLANVLRSKGDLKRRLGDLEEALELYGEAESLYRRERDNLGLANVLRSKGDLKRRLGDLEEALELYREAEGLYRRERDNLGLANLLRSKGDLKHRLGDLEEALELYGEAEGLYRRERSNLGLANVLRSKGDLKRRLGDVEEALKLYREAEGLYRRERSNLGLANVFRSKGDLKRRLGDLEEALELYGEAEGLYRDEQNNLGLANVLRSKGDLKRRLGDVEEALELYGEAEGLYRDEQNNLGLANVLRSKGDLKRRLGDLEEALELYGKAAILYQRERDNLGLANILQGRGDIYQRQNKLHKAVEIYEQALFLYKTEKEMSGAAYTMSELCLVYSLCGECEKASKTIAELNEIFDKIPYEDIKSHITKRIYEANENLKNLS